LVWKTELPFKVEPTHPNSDLEEDAQMCIVTGLQTKGSKLIATDCHGKQYVLSQKTGRLRKQ
jgi:hypothetical protein